MENKSIMIVGVGGQGTLLASKLIGTVLLSQNFDVKLSEVHGMSQRGGSVTTYVKYGKQVFSPVVEFGEADIILAFELLEAARALPYLKEGGKLLVNNQKLAPMPVITGAMKYPEDLIEKIKKTGCDITVIDALKIAQELGNAKAANVVMMGALSQIMGFDQQIWIDSLKKNVPQKFLDLNLRAFSSTAPRG